MIELVDATQQINRWVVRKPNGGVNSFHYAFSFRNKEGALRWIESNEPNQPINEFKMGAN